MEKKFKVVPPTMPNFVRFEKESGLRQDGFKAVENFDIRNFTEAEAVEFGNLMKDEFIKHWKNRQLKS
jgi:hypothetical protein